MLTDTALIIVSGLFQWTEQENKLKKNFYAFSTHLIKLNNYSLILIYNSTLQSQGKHVKLATNNKVSKSYYLVYFLFLFQSLECRDKLMNLKTIWGKKSFQYTCTL